MLTLQIISIVLVLLLGLIVLLRKSADRSRRAFFFLTLFMALWILAGIFANTPVNTSLLWNRLTFVFAPLAVLSGYMFVHALASQGRNKNKILTFEAWVATLLSLLVMPVIVFTDTVVRGVVHVSDQEGRGVDVIRGDWYVIYILLIIFLGGIVALRLLGAIRQSTGQKKNQLQIVLLGCMAALALGLVVAFLLPTMLNSSAPSSFSYLSGFVAVGVFMYAITKHRLFDIRFAIARTLTYILLLITSLIIYAVGVFAMAQLLFGTNAGGLVFQGQTLIYFAFSIVLALTYSPLKRFFDKVTDGFFYRRDYVLERVLSQFEEITTNEINPKKLSTGTLQILYNSLKPEFVCLQILSHGNHPERTFRLGREFDLKNSILEGSSHFPGKVLITDYIEGERFYNKLVKSGIAVIVRLETSRELVGYIVLGNKRSGNIYNNKDEQLLKSIGNELALATQNSLRFEEIQEFNETLQQKIDVATDRLRNTNRKLRQLDATKDEFVSMASHQLRTPLTSVKGYLSMVLEGDAGKLNPAQEKLLKEAYSSSERMVRLIGDFLNVSRLRTGKFVVERSPVNLAKLIDGEIGQLEATAATRELTLRYHKPVEFPEIQLDKGKIQQVIMNFIDNAIFYSKPGGEISIELLKKDGEVVFKVKDQGIGVPAEEKRQIFTKFFRASNARRQRPDGTGIGLFMAQKIIVAHGGVIIFDSVEGKGSTFGFRLPTKQPEGQRSKRLG